MSKLTLLVLPALFTTTLAQAAPTAAPATKEIKVLSNRTEAHLKPLFEAFEKRSGIKVVASYVTSGFIERLESRPTEADLVITAEAELLEQATEKKLLQPYVSKLISAEIPTEFREAKGSYFVDAYRARTIVAAKAKVKPSDIATYADLANPKWKGKLCIRSGFHEYNISLFSQFVAVWGVEKTKTILTGIHNNLARAPVGNDREQARGIFEGKCELALLNSYYYPMMLSNPEQKPWAEALQTFLPEQKTGGTFVMRSAVGLTTAKTAVKEATQLMEYLASAEGQALNVSNTFQYPTNTKVAFHDSSKLLGQGQPDIKGGRFKARFVSLAESLKHREEVIKMLNEVNFDKMP
jgi:iron(III) transport system substrate-binding protein